MELRPALQNFALAMEQQLRMNDNKGGWEECDPLWLLAKLCEEVGEVGRILQEYDPNRSYTLYEHQALVGECADVANVAMMIADATLSVRRDWINGKDINE